MGGGRCLRVDGIEGLHDLRSHASFPEIEAFSAFAQEEPGARHPERFSSLWGEMEWKRNTPLALRAVGNGNISWACSACHPRLCRTDYVRHTDRDMI